MEMNIVKTDIDIDVVDREALLVHFDHIPAIIKKKDDTYDKHNSGVYLQPIPFDQLTGLSSIDYKEAEDRGYFKLDFLNNSAYTGIKDEAHLQKLLNEEPIWDLLQHGDVVSKLAHIHQYIDILNILKPTSVEGLAEVLAIIRPAKRYLLKSPASEIKKAVWTKPTDGSYYFKKAHAIAYAVSIVVQLNLFCEQVESNAV